MARVSKRTHTQYTPHNKVNAACQYKVKSDKKLKATRQRITSQPYPSPKQEMKLPFDLRHTQHTHFYSGLRLTEEREREREREVCEEEKVEGYIQKRVRQG